MNTSERAAVILAGGDGKRLSDYIRKVAGVQIPKQFFPVTGEVPLLVQTRQRASLSVPSARIYFSLNRDHESFYQPLLADVRADNLVVQPRNRGTAPAILYALLRVADSAAEASVVLMPSDHYVGNEPRLVRYIEEALEAVERRPKVAVLLGVTPGSPETGYGWIEPGSSMSAGRGSIFRVRRFWEKPSRENAIGLMANGCLWNSFIVVARISALLDLFRITMPQLHAAFSRIRPSLGTALEEKIAEGLYRSIGSSDFSNEVLQVSSARLSVLQMADVGWSDLGEQQRVLKTLANLENRTRSNAA